MMPKKPKTQQKEDLVAVSGRDQFQTPNYAVDLLVPYLRSLAYFAPEFKIWECAAGLGKIVNRLKFWEFNAFGTDLSEGVNFLTDLPGKDFNCIVTNPPFSLKKKFYDVCANYGVPFALLIPCDYSTWIIQAKKAGAEVIVPEKRIDYITPNILQRIHEGEIWETARKKYPDATMVDYGVELKEFKESFPDTWAGYIEMYKDFCNWTSIYEVPSIFLKKYSSSYYHSMWLTKGFGLGKSETFVELTNDQKKFGI